MMFFLSSCGTKSVDNSIEKVATVNADSLIGNWNTAWSNMDSISISKMFAEQTQVVFSSKERIIGGDSIMSKWVRTTLPMVRNLKTIKYLSSATSDMAYYAGGYSLDIVRNDSVIGSDIGCFTAIWKKQQDKNWKMEMLFFGENKQD